MNHTLPSPRLHPAVLAAAVSVSAFSLAGIGVLTGVIPFGAKTAEAPPAAVQAIPAPTAQTTLPTAKPAAKAPIAKPVHTSDNGGPDIEVIRKAPSTEGARALKTAGSASEPAPTAAPATPVCHDCGVIESVREMAREGEGSGLGAAAGGVVGGILGRQIGNGSGRDIATVLGAIGGAVAGHQIEKAQKKTSYYEIVVRFDDGTSRVVTQDAPPSWREGDHVKFANGALTAN